MAPSPLLRHPLLAEALSADVHVKHENHNPTGAFKVRGGVNLIAASPGHRSCTRRHLGYNGQPRPVDGVCGRARRRAMHPGRATGQQPRKNALMRAWGATLIEHGKDFDDARELVERLCEERGLRYVHSANEPDLISGVGTYAWKSSRRSPTSTPFSCRSAAAAAPAGSSP
jgi:threonine dehydratase